MTPKVSDELEVFVEVGGARLSMRGDVPPEHLAAIMSAAALTLGSAAQIVLATEPRPAGDPSASGILGVPGGASA